MNTQYEDFDLYDLYAEEFDPVLRDRKERRARRPRVNHVPKKAEPEIIAETAEVVGLEGGFVTSYTPAQHEAGWLLASLRGFYEQELISDVEALLKGGKEANVYRCAAHPATGQEYLAAKVYRPRMFRNLRNDQQYRQGRAMLTPDGSTAKATDSRLLRALGKKTTFGQQVAHTSWLMHEYKALALLSEVGGDVPRPLAVSENAILMEYIGDGFGAAPALNEISLETAEAWPLFQRVLENIRLMLSYGRVHGDLSAYNILYWDGDITLIDFPQVVNSAVSRQTHEEGSTVNPDAYDILARDVQRVCHYFGAQGIRVNAQSLSRDLWGEFVRLDPRARLADASRWEE
jgi:RIO kinase 1